ALGGTAMRDAIEEAERYLAAQAVHPRQAILVVTDGNDNASTAKASRIRDQAQKQGVAIDAIGLLSEEDQSKAAHARADLDELAEATGGIAYFPGTVDEVGAIALDL